MPFIDDYMSILYLGMFALVGTLTANAALMAKGLMIKSTVVMGIGGLMNLVLDYILIFGMGPIEAMALKGAALATVISWGTTFIIMLILLYKEKLVSFSIISSINNTLKLCHEMFSIAMPAVAAQIINPIAIAVITRLVSQSGDDAVAAYGIATRIESLGLTGILALSVILTPVVAQNFGAGKRQRLDQVVAYAGRMTVYWGLGFFALMLLFAKPLAEVFTDNATVIAYVQDYLWIVGLSFPAFGLALISTSFFNGVYQASLSLKLTLIKSLILTIPLAMAGYFFGLTGLWLGIALANVLAAVYAGHLLFNWQKENDSNLVGHHPLQDYLSDLKKLATILKFQK